MSYTVTLKPSGTRIEVPEGQRVLTAAIHSGVSLNYSCRLGSCEVCVGMLVAGEVDRTAGFFPEHLPAGQILLCQAVPISDLVIEAPEAPSTFPPKTNKIMIYDQRMAAPDVMILHMRLPITTPLRFAPGQYIDLLLPDGRRRSYSIANTPIPEGVSDLELHVRIVPGGHFSGLLTHTLKVRDVLRFEGPLGSFFLRRDSDKPCVFLASGTGYAPIRSIIATAVEEGCTRPMHVYWGARTAADLYALEEARQWAREGANVTFTPVLSEPLGSDAWTGRTGLVHEAVMADIPDLSGHQVYACGAPAMVDAARADFSARCGLPKAEFFADAFLTEAETAHSQGAESAS